MASKKSKQLKMTQEEIELWDKICRFVHIKIMDYDEEQNFSRTQAIRLKGLAKGQYMGNANVSNENLFSYQLIYDTMLYCEDKFNKAKHNSFADDNHKFNYMMKIVENNINTVYQKLKKKKKSDEQTMEDDIQIIKHEGALYTPTANVDKAKNLLIDEDDINDLW